jgi:hypothetical protein
VTAPSIWRTELYHPLVVHLPIGILLLGAVYGIILELRRTLNSDFGNDNILQLFLIPGLALAWCAILTGGWAEDVVNRLICDPTVTQAHSDLAYTATYVFTIATVISLSRSKLTWKISRQLNQSRASMGARFISLLQIGLLIFGSYNLVSAAHLGATLVYQQGAGVYHPSDDCKEFE